MPNIHPPVCKALDFGKYKFQFSKNKQLSKSSNKSNLIKEIKLRPGIGEQDYQVKLKKSSKFVESGHKVKISLRFRGREVAHAGLGVDIVQRMITDLGELITIEKKPQQEGRQVIAVIAPKVS